MKLLLKIKNEKYSMSCLPYIFLPDELDKLKQSGYFLYYESNMGWYLCDEMETEIYRNDILKIGFDLLPEEITKKYLISSTKIDIEKLIREHRTEVRAHASIDDEINDRVYTFYADIEKIW